MKHVFDILFLYCLCGVSFSSLFGICLIFLCAFLTAFQFDRANEFVLRRIIPKVLDAVGYLLVATLIFGGFCLLARIT